MEKDIIKFIYELGMLTRIKHEGWKLIGVDNPDSVAEHSLRAAQIGFILAKMENYENPQEVCSIIVFHDMAECRVNDVHKVANRYITKDEARAAKEQTEKLGEIGEEIFNLWSQAEFKNTQAGIIAKDADLLETAVRAREYKGIGYEYAQDWINNVSTALKTESAKKLLGLLNEVNPNEWWQGLKKL